jgi:hypothetical protein
MAVVATKSAFSAAKSLLEHYGFDLGEQTSGQLLDRWGDQCDPRWIRLALIEALHQGRYKAVSVEQILSLWSRRGQPSYHFDREFEALICNNQPQDLASVSPRSDASESPEQGSKSTPETAIGAMAHSQASAGSPVQLLSQPKTEPNPSVQPLNPSSQTQSSDTIEIQQPEVKLPLPSSLNHRTVVPLGSSLLMDSDEDDDSDTDAATELPAESLGTRLPAEVSRLGTDVDVLPIDLDTGGWDAFVAGWEEAIIPNPVSGASIPNQLEVQHLDTLLTELIDTPAVDALDSVNPPAVSFLADLSAIEQQEQDLQNIEVSQHQATNGQVQIAIQDLDQDFGVEISNLQSDQLDQGVHLEQLFDHSDHVEAIAAEPEDSSNGIGSNVIGATENVQDWHNQPVTQATHTGTLPDAAMGLGSGSTSLIPQGGAITKFEPELQVSDVFNKLREIARIWKLQTSALPSSAHGQFPVIEPDIIRDFP